jgi:hypothetical protein
MRNKLTDLSNHLFAEIERLGDEDLKGEALAAEIVRAHALSEAASRVIDIGNLMLKAKIAGTEKLGGDVEVPLLLG